MPFVNDFITEADIQRIDFSEVKTIIGREQAVYPGKKWTVDRERDIGLIPLGGGLGDYPHFFTLYWQGCFFNAFLIATTTGDYPTHDLEVTWKLDFLSPHPLDVPEAETIQVLKEALAVYGKSGSKQFKARAVHFDFDGTHNKGITFARRESK